MHDARAPDLATFELPLPVTFSLFFMLFFLSDDTMIPVMSLTEFLRKSFLDVYRIFKSLIGVIGV